MPLGIDVSLILNGFWMQLGMENRAKIDQTSIQKGIPKMMEKRRRFGGFGGVRARGGDWGETARRGILDPPKTPKSKKITKTLKLKLLVTSRSVTRTPLHACAQARWRISEIDLETTWFGNQHGAKSLTS